MFHGRSGTVGLRETVRDCSQCTDVGYLLFVLQIASNIVDITNLNVLCYWHAHFAYAKKYQNLSCMLSSSFLLLRCLKPRQANRPQPYLALHR